MRRSTEHILTSHVGSLPRPDALIAANRARETGELIAEGEYQRILGAAVMEGVRRQHKIGIDVPCDGEFGKAMGQRLPDTEHALRERRRVPLRLRRGDA